MTTFVWKINGLQVMDTPEPNTVVLSSFTISGKEDLLEGSVSYTVQLLPANSNSFTPLDQVTEELVILWTKEALGDRVAAMETEVQEQIDSQKIATPQSISLPWA